MSRLVLASGFGSPQLQLLDIDTGEATPVPSPLDRGGYAFDHALARDGWVAVRIGLRVGAYRDGDLLRPQFLGEAWQVKAALEDDAVIMSLYPGRSRLPDELQTVVVVGADAKVRRSANLPGLGGLVGETNDGVVFGNGVWSWKGQQLRTFERSSAEALLEGEFVVHKFHPHPAAQTDDGSWVGVTRLEVRDGNDRISTEVEIPAPFVHSWTTSPSGTKTAAVGEEGILIVAASGSIQLAEMPLRITSPVWLGEECLLLGGYPYGVGELIFDVSSGETTALTLSKRSPAPRVDASGRFDPAQVRTLMLPSRTEPYTADEREAELTRQKASLNSAAPESLRPFVDRVATSIRLRSYMLTKRPRVGTSRLGGRPDLPSGMKWPTTAAGPMAFLAQIRLEDVAGLTDALPSTGLLLAFAELSEDAEEFAANVTLAETEALKRATWPRSLDEELRFGEAGLEAHPMLSLPAFVDDISDDDIDAWDTFIDENQPTPHHRMFGFPRSAQGESVETRDGVDLTLLLQIDGDGLANMEFADGGSIQIWISPADLAAQNFGNCTLVLDSF